MSRKAFFVLKELPWNAATWHSWNVRVRTNFMFACTNPGVFKKKKKFCYRILAGVCEINSKPYRFYYFQRNLPLSILVAVHWKQAKRDNLFHCCISSIWFLFYTVFWQMELKNEKDLTLKKYTYNVHSTGWFNPLRGLGRPIQGPWLCLGSFPSGRYCLVPLYTLCKVTLSR